MASRLGAFPGSSVIELDRWKSIVVHPHDPTHSHHLGGSDRVPNPHGIEITDRQDGKIQLRRFTDQFHIHRQRGVARVIKAATAAFDNEAARITPITPVGHRAAVDCGCELYCSKTLPGGPAVIHRLHIFEAFLFEPRTDFKRRNHSRAGTFGEGFQIRDMVAMSMGNKDEISCDLVEVDFRREWVRSDKGIKEERGLADLDCETGVSIIGELHQDIYEPLPETQSLVPGNNRTFREVCRCLL